ncbi:MAG: Smr/MutS family protein [Flavobacteriales bacterium]|nr:Smr/MutS family protein [Flavobacteriales bacterium]
MEIKKGDKIKFINDKVEGFVIDVLNNNKIKIKTSDGFEYVVDISEIIIVGDDNSIHYQPDKKAIKKKISESKTISEGNSILDSYQKNSEGIIEIDLHLEKIVKNPQKYEPQLKLHKQLLYAKKCIEAAQRKKISKLIFIHGKGTGALKSGLIEMLENTGYISVKEGSKMKYGDGAIEVSLKNITL